MKKQPFFTDNLAKHDKEIYSLIQSELKRQQNSIELIASENIVSKAVLEATGSILTNKYAEGLPCLPDGTYRRYYQGCEWIDKIENICINRCKKLFNCKYANVQPHSGASANLAVMFALAKAGDNIVGMSLDAGGHLTHGAAPTISGKWFKPFQYGLKDDGTLNYDELKDLVYKNHPSILIVGASAYSREIDFKKIKGILDEYHTKNKDKKCYYFVDMAHIAGLVATGLHMSPLPYADVVTSTTHKTLRGTRGAIILTNNEEIAKKIDRSVFPGCQGGPLEHSIAGKAVAFGEALKPEFKKYMVNVVNNCKCLASELVKLGYKIVSGGTDNHLILVDLTPKGITGKDADQLLQDVGITINKNAIPNDPLGPKVTSGVRLGTAAITSRGFDKDDIKTVAQLIDLAITKRNESNYSTIKNKIKSEVKKLCTNHPIY